MSKQEQDGAPRAETSGTQAAAPAYFAVITAPILDDRVLADSAKLLYGRITSLTDREGYCWATNRALSELTGYGERTITRLIAQLEERGHIWTQTVTAPTKGGRERRIYIGARAARGIDKIGDTRQFWRDGIVKNGDTLIGMNNKQEYNPPIIPPEGGGASGRKRSKPPTTKYAPDWKPERFAGFWAYYPRQENPQGAVKAWDRLKPSDELIATIGRALEKLKATDEWQRGIGIPHAATFLNGARWRDAEGKQPGKAAATRETAPERRLEAAPPAEDGGWTWVE